MVGDLIELLRTFDVSLISLPGLCMTLLVGFDKMNVTMPIGSDSPSGAFEGVLPMDRISFKLIYDFELKWSEMAVS